MAQQWRHRVTGTVKRCNRENYVKKDGSDLWVACLRSVIKYLSSYGKDLDSILYRYLRPQRMYPMDFGDFREQQPDVTFNVSSVAVHFKVWSSSLQRHSLKCPSNAAVQRQRKVLGVGRWSGWTDGSYAGLSPGFYPKKYDLFLNLAE